MQQCSNKQTTWGKIESVTAMLVADVGPCRVERGVSSVSLQLCLVHGVKELQHITVLLMTFRQRHRIMLNCIWLRICCCEAAAIGKFLGDNVSLHVEQY